MPMAALQEADACVEPAVLPLETTVPPDPRAVSETSRDTAGFETLLSAVVNAAYGYAFRLAHNRSDAEDLVQEAALLAFRGFGSFEPGSNFKGWFFKILTNCYRSKYRRERRRPTVDFDDTPDLYLYARSGEVGFPTDGPDPAAALLDTLGTERVVAALEQLPDEYRIVSTLYFMQDFSYEEIARTLDCPVGTVRSRLHRGRKILQKALWQAAEEAGVIPARSADL
jgi:RNA polymerase sigma-70 factor (ECF subfamily)